MSYSPSDGRVCFRSIEEKNTCPKSGFTEIRVGHEKPFEIKVVFEASGQEYGFFGITSHFRLPREFGAGRCRLANPSSIDLFSFDGDWDRDKKIDSDLEIPQYNNKIVATFFDFKPARESGIILICRMNGGSQGALIEWCTEEYDVLNKDCKLGDLFGYAPSIAGLDKLVDDEQNGHSVVYEATFLPAKIIVDDEQKQKDVDCDSTCLKVTAAPRSNEGQARTGALTMPLAYSIVQAETEHLGCVQTAPGKDGGSLLITVDEKRCSTDEKVNLIVNDVPQGFARTSEDTFVCRRNVSVQSLLAEKEIVCELGLPDNSGDANKDGKIDMKDLGAIKKEFNQKPETADFNADGKVDMKDLGILKQYFGLSFQ